MTSSFTQGNAHSPHLLHDELDVIIIQIDLTLSPEALHL
jgi:hypothetical protein